MIDSDNLSSGGQKSFKSIEDLKTKFQLEYKTERLISIPVVKLQDYRSVPVHLTEDDIRANIELEAEEIVRERIPKVEAKKREILSALGKLQFNPSSYWNIADVARKLNNSLFEDIFTGEKDCACKHCQSKVCNLKEAKKCNINKGGNTPQKKAKQALQTKWEEVLMETQENQPDENFVLVKDFAVGELKRGIHIRMQDEIQGILANMVGRNTENNLTATLERLVGTRPGLLLNGFNVRENLKLFFDAFNIKLKASRLSGLGADASRRERSVPARGRFHLGRGGQSVNSMKLYNFSSWEPGKKHQSTCRVS